MPPAAGEPAHAPGLADHRPGLVDHTVGFVGALRNAGLAVSLSETLDAVRALGRIDLLDREALRAALAATCVKRAAHRRAFDTLFDLWWPALRGDGTATPAPRPGAAADGPGPGEGEPRDRDALRQALLDVLLSGDEGALRRLARESVAGLGRADTQPGRQSWFSYRVLRRLNPQTLTAALLDAILVGQERGGLAEKVARQAVAERLRQFEEMVEGEVRRRLAEDKGVEAVSKNAVRPLAEQVEFLRATADDMAALRRAVFPLARRLATRLTAKRRLGRSGRLDFRRTVRASLATGGVPLVTHHKPHKPSKPELVVLCDVSGSVSGFAHFTLLLAYALREQFTKVRAFAFIDTTDEVTRFFRDGADFADAMKRMSVEADLVWFDGHSDYGHAIEVFAERWPDAVTPRTSLLVLGDARNNHRATGVPTLRALARTARHAYWLNPEPRAYWGSGDSVAQEYGEVVEMVECRTAEQLAEFVQRLLPV
ncbi:MAG: VWA domain-containing protein [Actinomycetota bacterium]|nr:VWA domain-containing protein [Actinomycetota bacterium]